MRVRVRSRQKIPNSVTKDSRHTPILRDKLTRHRIRMLGAYWSYLLGGSAPGEQSVRVIILDTRFHRDSHIIPSLAGISNCPNGLSFSRSLIYICMYVCVCVCVCVCFFVCVCVYNINYRDSHIMRSLAGVQSQKSSPN